MCGREEPGKRSGELRASRLVLQPIRRRPRERPPGDVHLVDPADERLDLREEIVGGRVRLRDRGRRVSEIGLVEARDQRLARRKVPVERRAMHPRECGDLVEPGRAVAPEDLTRGEVDVAIRYVSRETKLPHDAVPLFGARMLPAVSTDVPRDPRTPPQPPADLARPVLLPPDAPEGHTAVRPPQAISLVIDRSGSMTGERLAEAAIVAAAVSESVTNQRSFSPDDLSIAAFAREVIVIASADRPRHADGVVEDLLRMRNFGKKSLEEIKALLEAQKLNLGMMAHGAAKGSQDLKEIEEDDEEMEEDGEPVENMDEDE